VALRVEISCVCRSGRDNPFESIKEVGGRNSDGSSWALSELAAINGIRAGKWDFFVTSGGRARRVVVGRTPWGYEYLKTDADGDTPDLLLALPEAV